MDGNWLIEKQDRFEQLLDDNPTMKENVISKNLRFQLLEEYQKFVNDPNFDGKEAQKEELARKVAKFNLDIESIQFLCTCFENYMDNENFNRTGTFLNLVLKQFSMDSDDIEVTIYQKLDDIGRDWGDGWLTINGDLGHYVGAGMKDKDGNKIVVNGSVGNYLAYGMKGGEITVENAKDYAGQEMEAGTVVIKGNAGSHIGCKMKSWGCIKVKGNAEDDIGNQMSGGEIIINNVVIKSRRHERNIGENMKGGLIKITGQVTNEPDVRSCTIGDNMTGGEIVVSKLEVESCEVGYKMSGKEIIIKGSFRGEVGLAMQSGKIMIDGSLTYESTVGRGMRNGEIDITGDVYGRVGNNMFEGSIRIGKDVYGSQVGYRMSSGKIDVKGKIPGISTARTGGIINYQGHNTNFIDRLMLK